MTNLRTYNLRFAFDNGLNLVQQVKGSSANSRRMITCQSSNRAIDELQYSSLKMTATQKANLDQALQNKGIFDGHGNQLKTKTGQTLGWDYRSMLQTTTTEQSDGSSLKEYNIYAKAGRRSRKVTETTNIQGNTTEVTEALYLGNIEYRTIWKGKNINYDGETVAEQGTGNEVTPYEKYSSLRIRQGHKQVARKIRYNYKSGLEVSETEATYTLNNNIDSCELTLSNKSRLVSYESYKPYGETAISYGKTSQQPYKYSGQEKDQSGLYYYGFRNLLPDNFRWLSPDPAGIQGSGLNWYAMVNGNPVTLRDVLGLEPTRSKIFKYAFNTLLQILFRQSKASLVNSGGSLIKELRNQVFSYHGDYDKESKSAPDIIMNFGYKNVTFTEKLDQKKVKHRVPVNIKTLSFKLNEMKLFKIFQLHKFQFDAKIKKVSWPHFQPDETLMINANGFGSENMEKFETLNNLVFFSKHGVGINNMPLDTAYGHYETKKTGDSVHNYRLTNYSIKPKKIKSILVENKHAIDAVDSNSDNIVIMSVLDIEKENEGEIHLSVVQQILHLNKLDFEYHYCSFCRSGHIDALGLQNQPSIYKPNTKVYEPSTHNFYYDPLQHFGKVMEIPEVTEPNEDSSNSDD